MRVKGKGAPAAFDHPRKTAVLDALAAIPAGQALDFAELRAKLSATRTQLRDSELHQIALDAGYEVEP